MLLIVKKFKELSSTEQSEFKNFCIEQSLSNELASSNMFGEGPNSLNYILENTERFCNNNGEFFILYADNQIAACSGVYKADFNIHIAIAGTRTWTIKKFKNKSLHRNLLLPIQKSWALSNNIKQVAICFNDYNKNLIEAFYRNRIGESIRIRKKEHLFFSNINHLKFPVNIQNTKQWVLYEKIDPNWDFDWKSIEYVSRT
jgi:hypothetical protein